jgi:heterodisulfide reductase subunit A-like polyferredoxin
VVEHGKWPHGRFKDHVLQREIRSVGRHRGLSTGMRAEENEELASILKVAQNQYGYFMEAHVKLRPVDMATTPFSYAARPTARN